MYDRRPIFQLIKQAFVSITSINTIYFRLKTRITSTLKRFTYQMDLIFTWSIKALSENIFAAKLEII